MELVSIIIPVFNRLKYLDELLNSIENQTYLNWEVIFVDDGSTDGSYEYLQEYVFSKSNYKLILRPSNYIKGANSCRNIGWDNARGNYLIFFDSDDVFHPEKLKTQVDIMNSSNCDIVIGTHYNFNTNIEEAVLADLRKTLQLKINATNYLLGYLFWITGDVLYKKKSIDEKVRFDPKLKSGQEYHMNLGVLFDHKIHIEFCKDAIFYHRVHPESIQQKLKVNPSESYSQKIQLFFTVYHDYHEYLSPIDKIFIEERILRFYVKLLRYKRPNYTINYLKKVLNLSKKEILFINIIDLFYLLSGRRGEVLMLKFCSNFINKQRLMQLNSYYNSLMVFS